MNSKVLFIGCGLIAGSFLLNLIENYEVEVLEKDSDTIDLISKMRIKTYTDINQISKFDYEFICLGMYPLTNKKFLLNNINKFENCKIIDFSGLQNIYLDSIEKLNVFNIQYLATHPMCGREVSGFENSLQKLFCGKNVVLNQITKCDSLSLLIEKLYISFGAKIIKNVDTLTHDEIVTYTSQIPHVLSLAYTKLITNDKIKNIAKISSNSFNEFSRISNINEKLWTQVFCDNSAMITKDLDKIIESLEEIKKLIMRKDSVNIDKYLIDSRKKIVQVEKLK